MSNANCPCLIREDQFLSEMKETVEPCLEACLQESFLCREEGHPIYCAWFVPEEPKAAVVLSHGFTETADKYREVIWYFLQMGYAVAAMEHCGHGRSYGLPDGKERGQSDSQEIGKGHHREPSGREEIRDSGGCGQQSGPQGGRDRVHVDTWTRYCEDLLFAAHAAGDRFRGLPLFLFGHSMGGGIAAAAAAKEPSLFAGVVLSSPMIRPVSGGIPWLLTKGICGLYCAAGKAADYAPGQGPCNLGETFEDSAGSSRPRFQYYQEIRRANTYAQMGGATYGWMRAAAKLSDWLLADGWKTISCPLLLFQADKDSFVMNAQQTEFMQKVQTHNRSARLIHVDGTRHEIFNSGDGILREYWAEIAAFCGGCIQGNIE